MAGRAVGRDGKAGCQEGRRRSSLLSPFLSSPAWLRWREFGTRTKGKPKAGQGRVGYRL